MNNYYPTCSAYKTWWPESKLTIISGTKYKITIFKMAESDEENKRKENTNFQSCAP